MLKITQITRIDGVAVSVKFNNGIRRYYCNTRRIWIASERETSIILKALK